jgi:hypothetical protein
MDRTLHGFLDINDREILNDAGKISHKLAIDFAESEFRKFTKNQSSNENEFDKLSIPIKPAPHNK